MRKCVVEDTFERIKSSPFHERTAALPFGHDDFDGRVSLGRRLEGFRRPMQDDTPHTGTGHR